MSKQVRVTGAQRDAARMIVNRSTAQGRPVSSNVRKIADASTKLAGPPTSTAVKTRAADQPPMPSGDKAAGASDPPHAAGAGKPLHSATDIFKMIRVSFRRGTAG